MPLCPCASDMRLASHPTRRKPSPGHAVWPTPPPCPVPTTTDLRQVKHSQATSASAPAPLQPNPAVSRDHRGQRPATPFSMVPASCRSTRLLSCRAPPLSSFPSLPRSPLLLPDMACSPAPSTLPPSEATQVPRSMERERRTGAPRPPATHRAPLTCTGGARGRPGQLVPLCRSRHFPRSFPGSVHLFAEPVSLTHCPALPRNPHRPPTIPRAATCFLPRDQPDAQPKEML